MSLPLLNEKRSEIYRLEARLKVGIILVPNIHMETPNYIINRLKHEDLKSTELPASYEMVEKFLKKYYPLQMPRRTRHHSPKQQLPVSNLINLHQFVKKTPRITLVFR